MREIEVELRFKYFTSDKYTLQYREKNFIPQEIEPTSFFGRLNRLILEKSMPKMNGEHYIIFVMVGKMNGFM